MSTVPLPKKKSLTPAEYLAIERAAEFRSELIDGEMVAMAGGTRRHSRIAVNLISQLDEHFRGSRCEVFNSDMRVKVSPSGLYTYPDVSVACAPIEYEDANEDTLLNPRILIEVLSKSTENRDRGWKFEHYFDLPSLVDYVLVSQDRPFVEHFVRRADGQRMFEFVKGGGGNAAISCCRLRARLERHLSWRAIRIGGNRRSAASGGRMNVV